MKTPWERGRQEQIHPVFCDWRSVTVHSNYVVDLLASLLILPSIKMKRRPIK